MLVLLTGGLGYIGSHLSIALLQAGHGVLIVDNLVNASLATLAGIKKIAGESGRDRLTFIREDLLNYTALVEICKSYPLDAVVHLAGLKAVAESLNEPLSYYHTNIVSTLNLLKALEASSCRQLIFSSSATVYGNGVSPLFEEHPTGRALSNPYGKTKYLIEELLGDYHQANPRFAIVVLRYFNPVGAHPSGIIGEAPLGIPNNLVPVLANVAFQANRSSSSAQGGEGPLLSVFGNDYPSPDGTCLRDFIHVCDLSAAHLAALSRQTGLSVYNVGTGTGTSVLSLISAYGHYNQLTIPYRFAPRRPGDCASVYCNADKIGRELGWRAQKTLEDIVRDSWAWTLSSREAITP